MIVKLVGNDPPKGEKENKKENLGGPIHEYYHCIDQQKNPIRTITLVESHLRNLSQQLWDLFTVITFGKTRHGDFMSN